MKVAFKCLFRSIARIIILPLYLFSCLVDFIRKDEGYLIAGQILSQVPGLPGVYLRREFYRITLNFCSHDCFIGFGTIFPHKDVSISDGVYIGNFCSISSAKISSNTYIASRVSIISGTQQHVRNEEGILSEFIGTQSILIGQSCWIGEGSIIAADIGNYSNVAAGAVVLKAIGGKSSVIGNPAREIKA